MAHRIDSDSWRDVLKPRIVKPADRRVLISQLAGSKEAEDGYTLLNCQGFGRVRAFRNYGFQGVLDDPLEKARTQRVLCSDYPGRSMVRTQVFQLGGCSWRCWYCYVDVALLSGDSSRGSWLTCDDLLDLYEEELRRADIIDLSGGQPDLVPEWPVWMLEALDQRSYRDIVFLRSEDNLTGPLIRQTLSESDLRLLASRSYTRIGCFKGFDEASFTFNTRALKSGFVRQFENARDIIEAGIDFFAYVTLTGPDPAGLEPRLADFFDRMQAVHPLLPLRVVPLKVSPASAWRDPARQAAVDAAVTEERALALWTAEMIRRFPAATRSRQMEEIRLG